MPADPTQYIVRPDRQVVMNIGPGNASVRLQPGSALPAGIPRKDFLANVKKGLFILNPSGIQRPVQIKGSDTAAEIADQIARVAQRKIEGELTDQNKPGSDEIVGVLASKDALTMQDISGLDIERLNLLAVERGHKGAAFDAYPDAVAFLTQESRAREERLAEAKRLAAVEAEAKRTPPAAPAAAVAPKAGA